VGVMERQRIPDKKGENIEIIQIYTVNTPIITGVL